MEIVIYLIQDIGAKYVAALECSMTILLSIMFGCVLILFMKMLKEFSINKTLSTEKKSVRKQFYVFFIAFSMKAVYSAYWLYTTFKASLHIAKFEPAVVYTVLWIPWNILPLSIVFYTHYKSFI